MSFYYSTIRDRNKEKAASQINGLQYRPSYSTVINPARLTAPCRDLLSVAQTLYCFHFLVVQKPYENCTPV